MKVGFSLIGKVYWVCIGRGLDNVIFRGIFHYVVKLRVFFGMPRTHVIHHTLISEGPLDLNLMAYLQ